MIIISLPRQAPYVCKLFPLELIATLAYWGASIAWSAMLPMFPCPCFMLSHSFTPLPTPPLPCAVWNWLDFMHKLHSHRSLGCGKRELCLPASHAWIFQIFRFSALSVGITYAPWWPSTIGHCQATATCKIWECNLHLQQHRKSRRGCRRRGSKCSGKRLTKFALNAPVARCQWWQLMQWPTNRAKRTAPGTYANETQLCYSFCTEPLK